MSFTCPICNMTSYNKNDEINRYCGNCHVFIDDVIFQFGIDKLDKLIKDKTEGDNGAAGAGLVRRDSDKT